MILITTLQQVFVGEPNTYTQCEMLKSNASKIFATENPKSKRKWKCMTASDEEHIPAQSCKAALRTVVRAWYLCAFIDPCG
jgi:hypothetical protein